MPLCIEQVMAAKTFHLLYIKLPNNVTTLLKRTNKHANKQIKKLSSPLEKSLIVSSM